MSSPKPPKTSFFSRLKKDVKSFKEPKTSKTSVSITPLSGASVVAGTSATSGGTSGSNNSAATSKNLQNASKQLDDYLKEMDDNDERIVDVISMSRFIEKAESYSNSSFKGCTVRQVDIDPLALLMVDLAAKSAKKVYNKSAGVQDLDPFAFEQVGESKTVDADILGGSIKATTVSLYKGRPPFTSALNDDRRVVVAAIRGTASMHDWLVNFNDAGKPASSVDISNTNTQSDFLGLTETGKSYTIHSGFLSCAQFMAPKIASEITDILKGVPESRRSMLIFTGHSAGGAVAALLYAHMLKSTTPNSFTPLMDRFATAHCITFGAPPITSPALLPFFERSTFMSFVNESDPIPRCDREYVNSLLRLWVTPMPKGEVKWELPESVLENAGQVIGILKADGEDGTVFAVMSEEGQDGLKGRVMGDPKAHKMDLYLKKLSIARVVEEQLATV